MRKIEYLSPTSLALYLESPNDFYLNYLADKRPPKQPQTGPMAAGSAFDAYVKSYLYNALFGKKDPKYELTALFEAQVEPQNRDHAYKVGAHCFDVYQKTGCLSDLMLELKSAIGDPHFELDMRGQVAGYREGTTVDLGPVTFLGKLDLFYTNKMGARVIVDWKVNGYYAKTQKTPMKGYIRLRDLFGSHGPHKEAMLQQWKGMRINMADTLDKLDVGWARQLSIYSWLCGEEVGSQEFVAGIDQLCCGADPIRPDTPKIKIAEHRLRIGKPFQESVFASAQHLWTICHNGHFFSELSLRDSQLKCEKLDKMVDQFTIGPKDNDEWLKNHVERAR